MDSSTDRQYAKALAAYRGGRLVEAEEILAQDFPAQDDAASLCLRGIVTHGLGRTQESLKLLRRAVSAEGAAAEHFNNLGILLHQAAESGEAAVACGRAVEMQPGFAEGWYNLGNALLGCGRSDEAIAALRKAVELRRDYVDAYNNLAAAYRQQGRLRDAIACCQNVLRLTPNDPKMHLNLGSLLRDVECFEDAMTAYRRAVHLQPEFVEAWKNLGALLRSQRRLGEAAECFETILRISPGSAEAKMELGGIRQAQGQPAAAAALYQEAMPGMARSASSWSALGTAMQEMGKLDEAIACYEKAIAAEPNYSPAYLNMGSAMLERDRCDDAIAYMQKALQIQPDFCEAWNNIGNAYLDVGNEHEAMRAYHRALTVRPDLPDGHWNKSLLLLLQGKLREGFIEYEWRWLRFKEFRRHLRQPLWDGSDLAGRSIILYAEQGFGDTIQFSRYLKMAAERGGKVVLECQPELKRLMAGLAGVQAVFGQNEPVPDCQLQMPLMSLPIVFETTLETIPSEIPYIVANAASAESWRERLANDGAKVRVGISWAGRPTHKRDRLRSCTLAQLSPLANIPGVQLYSLQKWAPGNTAAAAATLPMIDYTADFQDFSDTAALMANLDLIIGVDTAVVHLAGALGRPVWTMLPFNPDWRWMTGRDDSPWYPTMRLFRQARSGAWGPVIETVARELATFAKAARQA